MMNNELLAKAYELLEIELRISRNSLSDEVDVQAHKEEMADFRADNPDILADKFLSAA